MLRYHSHDSCCCAGGLFLGRLLLSLIFLIGGISKIVLFDMHLELMTTLFGGGAMAYLIIGILMELLGALLILLGWYTQLGCLLLMVFLLPVTFIVHGFWNYQGNEMVVQASNFLKNLAIYGGLTLLLSCGPGRWSLDAACCSKCD